MPKRTLHPVSLGERTNHRGKPIRNKILLSLPAGEFRAIRPHLEFVRWQSHRNLYEPNHKFKFAYFPNCGLISLVILMQDGRTVEVAVLGSEGFSGAASVMGLTRSPVREIVQIPGQGFRVPVNALNRSLRIAPNLRRLLERHAVVVGMQIAQTAACNRLHDVKQRLARWLLMAQDRVKTGILSITHDFLATMLGTDRPSVSVAASALQRLGIIEYTRGAVKILNRNKLEESCCECYRAIQKFNDQIGLNS